MKFMGIFRELEPVILAIYIHITANHTTL